MIGIIKFLWFGICACLLFVALEITLIGSMWVLRVVLMWWFDIDYVLAWKSFVQKMKEKADADSDIQDR